MAAVFVLAIATEREIGRVGKRGQKIEYSLSAGLLDFRSKLALKGRPLLFISCRLTLMHEVGAGRKIRKPDVVKIAAGEFCFWDSSGRSANGAQAKSFPRLPGRTESYDRYWHIAVNHQYNAGAFARERFYPLAVAFRRRLGRSLSRSITRIS